MIQPEIGVLFLLLNVNSAARFLEHSLLLRVDCHLILTLEAPL